MLGSLWRRFLKDSTVSRDWTSWSKAVKGIRRVRTNTVALTGMTSREVAKPSLPLSTATNDHSCLLGVRRARPGDIYEGVSASEWTTRVTRRLPGKIMRRSITYSRTSVRKSCSRVRTLHLIHYLYFSTRYIVRDQLFTSSVFIRNMLEIGMIIHSPPCFV